MEASITFLGSGTSMGVPTLGCSCAVCTSTDPRDRRLRPSIAVRWADHCVIIDTGPDFRAQALREGIRKVDAVLYTHSHADHILGLDDLRPLSFLNKEKMPLYADDPTAAVLEKIFDYTFAPDANYPNRARVALNRLGDAVEVFGLRFERVPLLHGDLEVAGFRFGSAAYLTDMSSIPPGSFELLRGLDVAIFDALRIKPHPSHSTLEQSIKWARLVGAKHSYFTHMSHEIAHEETDKHLPPAMSLAYDGLRVPFEIASATSSASIQERAMSGGPLSRQARRQKMQVFRSLAEVPPAFGPSVVSVGNFDGVHRGHQWILANVEQRAREQGARSVAVTFEPHPTQFLRPDKSPQLITPMPQRLQLLECTGIDAVVVLPFNKELSLLSAREFAETVLAGSLQTMEVHEGDNFRFGHKAEGGIAELTELGRELGFSVRCYGPLQRFGMNVSSSNIRELISEGEVSRARGLLGRPFSIASLPAHGRGIGSALTVPTVNLGSYDGLLPAMGVYVTTLRIGSEVFESVTNVGNRPTFGEDSFAVESHILNFHPVDLGDETKLQLSFLKRLRPEVKWPSPEALKAQIMRDVDKARHYFRLAHAVSTVLKK